MHHENDQRRPPSVPACDHSGFGLAVRPVALSLGDVEDLLAKRSSDVSYEAVRRWSHTFGPAYAKRIGMRRPQPSKRWHLDAIFVRISGRVHYVWRAVDAEGEVLDVLVQSKRNARAALKLMGKLLKRQGFVPDAIVTDRLRSYGSALRTLGLSNRHKTGGRLNNRTEVSHQPTRQRERQRRRFRSPSLAQTFLSNYTAVYNQSNVQTMQAFRKDVFAEWLEVVDA